MNLKLLKIARFFHLINKKNYNEKRQIEIVKNSPLFDAKWYLAQNPDVKAKKIGAAKHYVKYGWKEGRNPSPDFDTEEYLAEYPELEEKNWCPLFHYMLEHKELMPKIDYKEQIFNLLDKYTDRYKGKSADYKLIAKSKYFNKRWYLKTYPDVKKAKMDPIQHYMKYGWKEGRNPGPKFSTNDYLDLNADVKKAKINPLVHYEKYGKREERKFQNKKSSVLMTKFAGFIHILRGKKVRKVLLITHELTYTGAPLSLLKAAECLNKLGYEIETVSLKDGGLKSEFAKFGKIIITNNLNKLCLVASCCDLAIVNTLVLYTEYNALKGLLPTVWWIREPVSLLLNNRNMQMVFRNASNLYTMSEYSRQEFLPYNHRIDVIRHGLDDYYQNIHINNKGKLIFSVIGTIGTRKAQDVFLKAIKLLDEKTLNKCEFHIVGRVYDKKFFKLLEEEYENIPQVKLVDEITDYKSMISYYEKISCAVIPSRDEPTSRVALEAMMMGRPIIISDRVGAQYVLEEGKNGYMFESENIQALADCIRKMVKQLSSDNNLEECARSAYLQYNAIPVLVNNLKHMIAKTFSKNTRKQKTEYEVIKASKLFDAEWYLKTYSDVKRAKIDPAEHYLKFGWKEGRNPGPKFNNNSYLERYKDVRNANLNPLYHYEIYGKRENREIGILKDYKYYEKLPYWKYPEELTEWFKKTTKEDLNLKNPRTFNEKIQWLKLYDSTPIKTRLADKYLVRDWVKEKIGEQYLIPLLGVYDKFEDINFEKLPNQFVIKCNHGSGWNIIVKDKSKLDLKEAKEKIDKWMEVNFAFKAGLELQYLNMTPKIIIEQYIENKSSNDLYDYKFWCFDGKVKYIQFLSERNISGLKMAFYTPTWCKENFVYNYPLDSKNMSKPDNLDKMIQLAECLSEGFSHVRVDFYRMDNGILYFGEMTFTSMSGICRWNTDNINLKLGNMIKLPKLAYNIATKTYCTPKDCYIKNEINVGNILIHDASADGRNLKLTIVIPIYNALTDVKLCLASLLNANLLKQTKVLLMDDCSNKETQNYLQKFIKKHTNFTLYRNQQNQGFIKNCNKGIDMAKGDIVVLLNSDTRVPSGFDKRILQCFKSDKNIALASPLSTHSGLFNIPENNQYNLQQIDKVVQKYAKCEYPLITPEGFCFAIRKSVTDKIGKLDEIFGKGYCEEDDLVLRALYNGYKTVLIDNLIVAHKSHASFTSEVRKLYLEHNLKIFRRRWGNQQTKVREDSDMWKIIKNINNTINQKLGNNI